jgi:glycosyltransferase involved in cell wall biosynthesis
VAGSDHLFRVHADLFPAAERTVVRLPLVALPGGPGARPAALRTLGYLGALTEAKGVRVLLEAASGLREAGVALRIAGEGPLRPEVEAAGVDYAGRLEGADVDTFLLGCDAGVVPSTWDEPSGPPYTVCEWLASGRPVLTSRRGGLAEAEAMGGVIGFEPTPAALLDAVAALREDAWERAVDAVPEVVDDRDVERWLDEYEAIYAALRGVRSPG